MTTPLLIRAAELLELYARELAQSHQVRMPDGTRIWVATDEADHNARLDHDEILTVAVHLREAERSANAFANSLSQAFNTGDGSYHP